MIFIYILRLNFKISSWLGLFLYLVDIYIQIGFYITSGFSYLIFYLLSYESLSN